MVDQAIDADPFMCTPVAPPPGGLCPLLPAEMFAGTTPFGTLDLELDYFGAGDCITISQATIGLLGSCGEELSIQFSYPVKSGSGGGRYVEAGPFDRDARFQLRPFGKPPADMTAPIHVEVTTWQEGASLHDIDIVVTFTGTGFSVPPLHVHGQFCDWPYLLC